MTSLSIGSSLQNGKYKIVKLLGQGGFGITYLATHSILEKQVAIKEFFPKDFCDRESDKSHITLGTSSSAELVAKLRVKFVKEAKNIAKLSHPNIVPIQDIFEENNTAYYIMDYIEGESLGDILKREGALSEDRALNYICQIAYAIDHMHSRSMNHLDIKPGNIMIRKSDDMPILIDFGTSKQYDNEGEQTSTMAPGFTHGYAPIEQYKPGGVSIFTPQTDIYALGATLYALLTGKKPPHYSEILEDGLPSLGDNISKSTIDGIEHAMEVRKNKRPGTISEFLFHFTVSRSKDSIVTQEPDKVHVQPALEAKEEDDTVYAEVVSTLPDFRKEDEVPTEPTSPESNVIDGVEFVDLGLSVLWANMNVGAKRPEESGVYVNKVDSSTTGLIAEWNLKGALVPTISQFEELKSKCYWEPTEYYGVSGYDIIGNNGNKIFIPLSGDSTQMGFVNFGRLFTRESLYNSSTNQYYFYFNRQGDYKSKHYACDYKCPVRLIKQ